MPATLRTRRGSEILRKGACTTVVRRQTAISMHTGPATSPGVPGAAIDAAGLPARPEPITAKPAPARPARARPARTQPRGSGGPPALELVPIPRPDGPDASTPVAGGEQLGVRRRLPDWFIPRPRLLERLLRDRGSTIALLAAPAGYGKTSLLAQWSEQDERAFAWIGLDGEDNDPLRLLSTVEVALAEIEAADPSPSDEPASSPRRLVTSLPARLRRAADASPGGMVLALDGVQALTSPASLQVLSLTAAALPAGSKLALCSRTMPAIGLGRLRADRSLLAIGQRDLALTGTEARELLVRTDLDVGRRQLETLMERTEGWPAGLALEALTLREQGCSEGCSDGGAGRAGDVSEALSQYIREEVLADLPSESLSLLMRTSILDRLSPELCDVVLRRRDSGRVLRALAEERMLAAALDPPDAGYRCNPLLRDALLAELRRLEPGRARHLHSRAARWLGARGEVDRALDHAEAAGELDYAGELVWARVPRCTLRGEHAALRRWLAMFSEAQLASSPGLALAAAHSHLAAGEPRLAEHWSELASAAAGRSPSAMGTARLEAAQALLRAALGVEGIEQIGIDALRARELDGPGSPWLAMCCLLAGVSRHLGGDPIAARVSLRDGARRGAVQAPLIEALCLAQLAVIAAEEEDWPQAADLAARASTEVAALRLERYPGCALVLAASAWITLQQGRADHAKRDLRRARRLLAALEDCAPWYAVETRVLLARAAIRLADVALARTLLVEASRLARRAPEVATFRGWFDQAWGQIDQLSAAALSGPGALTMAELRILRFLPTHLSFREIGARLHVSTNTVKSQAHAVYRKLDAVSRSQAVERASALGLIDGGMG
jgi:LuxR family transcriptional regulator, maltose regulon positive regulatory protein